MKFQVKTFLLGSLLSLSVIAGDAKPDKSTSAKIPSQKRLKLMTKQTLLVWNQAIQTKDFTKIYNSAATIWKKKTTPEKIRQAFQGFIDNKINIQSIQNLEPIFKPAPTISKVHGVRGVLQVSGYYETKPERTEFDLMYVKEKETWKPALIHVYVGSHVFMGIDGEME